MSEIKRDLLELIHHEVAALLRSSHELATKHDLEEMERRLTALLRPKTKAHFDYSIEISQKASKRMPLQLKINDEQKVNIRLNPVTPSGKPVKVDGKPEWSVADGDSTLVVADDGMSAFLVSADTPGITNYMVSADADLGEGVDTISDTIQLTVVDPQATSLGLVADPPEAKTPPVVGARKR